MNWGEFLAHWSVATYWQTDWFRGWQTGWPSVCGTEWISVTDV